ncbi:hypothetical protein H2201_008895 [Coniosporium apollinis]|uniref:Nascent polypeptide-associated complex subunit alpha-like UBA domain-containing protein n=2 Tax=Coniosporium TaxID=2810619 RepID=A0ABQ9NFZ2_9PEZI|nr:hypothetical protein H2199_006078 [Cladosporium sp. JES 115]KAJ9654982.1 hypothetical protein H2201_008895 [Coniosporium apollinis]
MEKPPVQERNASTATSLETSCSTSQVEALDLKKQISLQDAKTVVVQQTSETERVPNIVDGMARMILRTR